MNIQDVGTKVQNSFSVPFKGDGLDGVLDKNHKATGSETKNCADPHDIQKVIDSASVCILENDPVFAKTSSSLRSTLHGIISYLFLNSFIPW